MANLRSKTLNIGDVVLLTDINTPIVVKILRLNDKKDKYNSIMVYPAFLRGSPFNFPIRLVQSKNLIILGNIKADPLLAVLYD